MAADLSLSVLDRIRVASPCTAKWDDMTPVASSSGADCVRRCEQCSLNVHDLSAMPREEAEALVSMHFVPGGAKHGQRLCGFWRKRSDGTIIFGDCPVGLARVRRRIARSAARVAAMVGLSSLVAACSDTMGIVAAPAHDDETQAVPGEMSFVEPPEDAAAPEGTAAPEARQPEAPSEPEPF